MIVPHNVEIRGRCPSGQRLGIPGVPVGLLCQGRKVVVVGGGRVAARRMPKLVNSGARVELIAPDVLPALAALAEDGTITWQERAYRNGASGRRLVRHGRPTRPRRTPPSSPRPSPPAHLVRARQPGRLRFGLDADDRWRPQASQSRRWHRAREPAAGPTVGRPVPGSSSRREVVGVEPAARSASLGRERSDQCPLGREPGAPPFPGSSTRTEIAVPSPASASCQVKIRIEKDTRAASTVDPAGLVDDHLVHREVGVALGPHSVGGPVGEISGPRRFRYRPHRARVARTGHAAVSRRPRPGRRCGW